MVLTELEKKENKRIACKKWNDKNKEKRAEYDKQYYEKNGKTSEGIKARFKYDWKKRGLDMDTFYYVYPIYIATTHCDRCNVLLNNDMYSSNQKCMDHCHATGMYRNTVCKNCNLNVIR